MAFATINKGSSYFNTVLYTGNGATQSITGVGFQPDFVWIKDRSDAYDHRLTDSVRGATKLLYSSLTNAEATEATSLTSFNSDGFSLGSANGVNSNTDNHVAWNWLGANSTTSNTAGTITSTVSANTTSGFSIVSYTGTGSTATVGHGLGAVPKMIILKDRDASDNWNVYTSMTGNNSHLHLNLTNAKSASSTYWNTTTPTSSLFSLGSTSAVNANGNDFIAYCFAELKGYSKFSSYTGNGNANGTFIYTGFKPAFVMTKRTDGADWWGMWDSKRLGYNGSNYFLRANTADVEANKELDILSNGFKIRTIDGGINASGGTYIYMAFAENPFVLTDGTPVTAR